jgi:hypothetical protein
MKKYSIKEIHLAKLRVLRDEFALKAKEDERKAKALRRAEDDDMNWELVKLGIKPLRQRRLFK